ncbi:MAG: DUF819 family protein [Bacteroidales bacterium]|nr:DUF819 family protein [Bacteroidales bacterium]
MPPTLTTITTLLYLFGIPLTVVLLAKRWPIINKISPMVILYVIGLVAGNCGWIGEQATHVCTNVSNVVVLLTIPLMLLGCNYKGLSAGMAVKAFFIGLFSVLAVTIAGFFIFRGQASSADVSATDFAKISAVMTGIYIGGIPNLAPVSKAIELPENLFLLVSSYDLIVTSLYLIVVVFFGRSIVRILFPKQKQILSDNVTDDELLEDHPEPFSKKLLNRSIGILTAITIATIAYGISLLIPVENKTVIIILSITTISIALSFWKPVKKLESTFDMGLYFVYVFCLAVASMVNIHDLELSRYLFILYYITFAVFGSLVLQFLFARLFKVDGPLTMAASIALINSPPFVPMVAATLKNKGIILPGIAIGLLGYAVGNYLGLVIYGLLVAL